MLSHKTQLILASQSPRRFELVSHLKIPFKVMVSDIDESCDELDPEKHSLEIAKRKAQKIVSLSKVQDPVIIVAADTIVYLKNKIYGKPKDKTDAEKILNELSGQTHLVCTAIVIKFTHEGAWFETSHIEKTQVSFEKITPQLLQSYLATNESLDKAGAYGIQGAALSFISKINGCYSNVVGFPLSAFCYQMQEVVSKKKGWGNSWQNYF